MFIKIENPKLINIFFKSASRMSQKFDVWVENPLSIGVVIVFCTNLDFYRPHTYHTATQQIVKNEIFGIFS